MSLRVLWSPLGCKGKAFQHFFFCAARFVHAFRLHEKATTFFLLCVLCLRSSFTRNAFLFGASCYVRAIAPATVPSLSQRIRIDCCANSVCGSGAHKQPFYFSGSKCCACVWVWSEKQWKIELYVTLCLCSRQLSVFGKVGMRVVVFAFAFVLVFVVCMPQDRSALCLFLLRYLSLLSFACCVFAEFLCW